jgi:DNA-directed RNA polymerase subunit RPC12/RpoP
MEDIFKVDVKKEREIMIKEPKSVCPHCGKENPIATTAREATIYMGAKNFIFTCQYCGSTLKVSC